MTSNVENVIFKILIKKLFTISYQIYGLIISIFVICSVVSLLGLISLPSLGLLKLIKCQYIPYIAWFILGSFGAIVSFLLSAGFAMLVFSSSEICQALTTFTTN